MALIRHDIYPARGRKQAKSALLAQRAAAEFATIFTPQGDGNLFAGVAQTEAYNIRHDIYPARGRKREGVSSLVTTNNNSPRYLPRKGTETSQRKYLLSLRRSGYCIGYSPRYLPRKGTETLLHPSDR